MQSALEGSLSEQYQNLVHNFIDAGKYKNSAQKTHGEAVLRVEQNGKIAFEDKGNRFNIFVQIWRAWNKNEYQLPGKNLTALAQDFSIIHTHSREFEVVIEAKAREELRFNEGSLSSDQEKILDAKMQELKNCFEYSIQEVSIIFQKKFDITFDTSPELKDNEILQRKIQYVFIDRAIQSVRDNYFKTLLLLNTVQIQAQNGDVVETQKTLEAAKKSISLIEGSYFKVALFCTIARIEIQNNNEDNAQETLKKARKAAHAIDVQKYGTLAAAYKLYNIAQVQEQIGNTTEAKGILKFAREIIEKKPIRKYTTLANKDTIEMLFKIARKQIQMGDKREVRKALKKIRANLEIMKGAHYTVTKSIDIDFMMAVLVEVAQLLVQIGDGDDAERTIEDARDILEEARVAVQLIVDNTAYKDRILEKINWAQSLIDDAKRAKKDMQFIEGDSDTDLLVDIARARVQNDDKDGIKEAIKAIQTTIRSIGNNKDTINTLINITQIRAQIEDRVEVKKAIETIKIISRSIKGDNKINILTNIAQIQTQMGDMESLKETISHIRGHQTLEHRKWSTLAIRHWT